MQFFKNFFQNQKQKKIKKMGQKLASKNTTLEGREAAFEYLKDIDTVEARFQLLQRFEYNNEKTILDNQEKEAIKKELMKTPLTTEAALKEYVLKTQNITPPLLMLKELLPSDQWISLLLSLLNFNDITFNKQAQLKNNKILQLLKDLPNLAVFEKIWPLAVDLDDDGVLLILDMLDQIAHQESVESLWNLSLESLMINRDPSSRVYHQYAHFMHQKHWKFKNESATWNAIFDRFQLPFQVDKKGFCKKR